MSYPSNNLGDSKDSSDQWLMKNSIPNEFSQPHSAKEITGGPCGDCASRAINCTVPILLQAKQSQKEDYQMNRSDDGEYDKEKFEGGELCSRKGTTATEGEEQAVADMMQKMRLDEVKSTEMMEALVSKSGIMAPAIVYRNSATNVDTSLKVRDTAKSIDYCPPKKKIRSWTPPCLTASTSSGYVSSEGKLAQKSVEELRQQRSHIFPNVIFENENENQSKTSSASSASHLYTDRSSSNSSNRVLKLLSDSCEDGPSKSTLMEVKVISPHKSLQKSKNQFDSSVSSYDEDEVYASNIKFEHLYMTTINSTSSASDSDYMRVKKKRRKKRNLISSASSLSKWDEIKEFKPEQQVVSEAELNDPYFEGLEDNPEEFYLKTCTNSEVPKIFDKELHFPTLKVTAKNREIDVSFEEDDIPYQYDDQEEEEICDDPYFMFRRIGRRCLELDNRQTLRSRLDDSSIESIMKKTRRRKMRAEDLFRAVSYEELNESPRCKLGSGDTKTYIQQVDTIQDYNRQVSDTNEEDEQLRFIDCFRFLISVFRRLFVWCFRIKPSNNNIPTPE